MKFTYYRLFGLNFASEIAFHGVAPLVKKPDSIDVQVRRGQMPAGMFTAEPHFQVVDNKVRLHVPAVANYGIIAGKEIIIEAEPTAHPMSISLYLLGSAMGALLKQRGFLVLHGNAIALNNHECVMMVGPSGIGKSTLAYAFHRLGYRVLADDVSAISFDTKGIPYVMPGIPRIKLWADMLKQYQVATARLDRVSLDIEKYQLPLGRTIKKPLRLRCIYGLQKAEIPHIQCTPLGGSNIFDLLQKNTYRYHFLPPLNLKSQHFQQCCQLANQVKLYTLERPVQGYSADAMAQQLIEAYQHDSAH